MFEGGKITQWRQGDYEISIRQMNPYRSMKVLGDLQKILLPVIGGAVEGLKDSSDNAEMIAAIGGALGQIAGSVDGDKCTVIFDSGIKKDLSVSICIDAGLISIKKD